MPNTFMAVILDTMNPTGGVHSPYKQPVGARLARAGLEVAYGVQQETLGPTVEAVTWVNRNERTPRNNGNPALLPPAAAAAAAAVRTAGVLSAVVCGGVSCPAGPGDTFVCCEGNAGVGGVCMNATTGSGETCCTSAAASAQASVCSKSQHCCSGDTYGSGATCCGDGSACKFPVGAQPECANHASTRTRASAAGMQLNITFANLGSSGGIMIRNNTGFEVLAPAPSPAQPGVWTSAAILAHDESSVVIAPVPANGTMLRYLWYGNPCGLSTFQCAVYVAAKPLLGHLSGELDFLPLAPFRMDLPSNGPGPQQE